MELPLEGMPGKSDPLRDRDTLFLGGNSPNCSLVIDVSSSISPEEFDSILPGKDDPSIEDFGTSEL